MDSLSSTTIRQLRQTWIREVGSASTVLLEDTRIIADQFGCMPQPLSSDPTSPTLIWGRILIRNVVGWADAVASIMGQCALDGSVEKLIGLSSKEKRIFTEPGKAGVLNRVKFGYKAYPRLFGAEFQWNLGGEDWGRFREATRARHRTTHPTDPSDFLPLESLSTVNQLIEWLMMTDNEVLALSAKSVGLEADRICSELPPEEIEIDEVEEPFDDATSDDSLLSLDRLSAVLQVVDAETLFFLGKLQRADARFRFCGYSGLLVANNDSVYVLAGRSGD